MKCSLVAILFALALSAPTLAAEPATTLITQYNYQTPPTNLVGLASQGYFTRQGIPGSGRLNYAVKTGKVNAIILVKAAIAQGRLSPETLNDSKYLSDVNFALIALQKI
jgi:hypothetical protein